MRRGCHQDYKLVRADKVSVFRRKLQFSVVSEFVSDAAFD